MKIIKIDACDREGPKYDDVCIAQNLTEFWAKHIVDLLNQPVAPGEDFYRDVADDYELKAFEP